MMELETVFLLWKKDMMDLGTGRFVKRGRADSIQKLADYLFNNSISEDDARLLKSRVVAALVTKEGIRAGKKEYRNWKPTVEEEFLTAIAVAYNSSNKPAKTTETPRKSLIPVRPRSQKIVDWVTATYGYNELLIELAHQPMNFYRLKYFETITW